MKTPTRPPFIDNQRGATMRHKAHKSATFKPKRMEINGGFIAGAVFLLVAVVLPFGPTKAYFAGLGVGVLASNFPKIRTGKTQ